MDSIEAQTSRNSMGEFKQKSSSTLPQLPLDLRAYKTRIILFWGGNVLVSCILPLVIYFTLSKLTSLEYVYVFTIAMVPMGLVVVASLLERLYLLGRKDSKHRPLGSESRKQLDIFMWNFLFGFGVVTAVISVGIATERIDMLSLPTAILLFYVSLEILLDEVLLSTGVAAPFALSSVAKGQALVPATYFITEDVCAVDGKLGRRFRTAWRDRYNASPLLRSHLRRMDFTWATGGLVIVAVVCGFVFGLREKPDVGYALGWGLPWLWGAVMTMYTFHSTKKMLQRENRAAGS